MAKRDVILAKILEGGATKESLMVDAEVNDKGLASQMTYLRLMGTCPRKKKDGTYEIVTKEVWEESRGAKGAGKALTPDEQIIKGEKKEKSAATAVDRTKALHLKDPENVKGKVKYDIAVLSLQLASIELGELETKFPKAEGEATLAKAATDIAEAVEASGDIEATEGGDDTKTAGGDAAPEISENDMPIDSEEVVEEVAPADFE
jgi:hypothetical protein